jgi:porin
MSRSRTVARALLVVFALVADATVAAAASPSTPDRPGRATPNEAAVPQYQSPTATSRPATTRPTEAVPDSDADLLNETAHELQVATPAERPDLELLRWYGLRPQVEARGVNFQGTFTADYSRATQGMNTRTDAFRELLDARLNVDTKALLGLYGGTFSVDFQNQNGRNGSAVLTGDVQGFDNADADGRTQISELWYQQLLFNDKLRVKFGKVDANTEFAFPANGAGFLNSSFGHAPTIVDMPTYPDPAMSLNGFLYPTRHFYLGAGVYDGSKAEGVNTGGYGPKHAFTGHDGYFLIGEAGAQWAVENQTLPGRLAVGGWGSTSQFQRFDGTVQGGTGGMYVVAEQTLWHKLYYNQTDPQGITSFLQYGHADPHVSGTQDYVGGGLVWTGPLADRIPDPQRQNDAIGVGVAYARLSTQPGTGFGPAPGTGRDFELSAEAYYSLQVTRYLQVKPDVQYIVHPAYAANHDAVVLTLRAILAF